ncbi:MazG nucleotide pyrophosphohydrolase domain-containing protein [Candidatus Paracaedibacter symbiosus]|uniref:MazG nucleotide pyrophosphohydrolase domain-containing protein n=1 Tax=Candidatus Paracaedibacter symbiosus TaxID=244582 RepID=UPI000509B10B|nr:MazG nucleotide pyrophosphohydrolase domain-containing protein [Candidatus Paracaedibacter symbiosus]
MTHIIKKLVELELEGKDFGFYWQNTEMIFDQVISECNEIREAIVHKEGAARLQEEVGDLLHAAFSLCVFLKFDVEETLTQATNKFEKRFSTLKQIAQEEGYAHLRDETNETLMQLWNLVKQREGT